MLVNIISFKLRSLEMPLRFMGKWMNSNNRHEVTDHTFATEKMSKDERSMEKIKFRTGPGPALSPIAP